MRHNVLSTHIFVLRFAIFSSGLFSSECVFLGLRWFEGRTMCIAPPEFAGRLEKITYIGIMSRFSALSRLDGQ